MHFNKKVSQGSEGSKMMGTKGFEAAPPSPDIHSSRVPLTRYDGEVSEPLVGRQGSRVSMRVARASASLLSSHGRVPGTSPG